MATRRYGAPALLALALWGCGGGDSAPPAADPAAAVEDETAPAAQAAAPAGAPAPAPAPVIDTSAIPKPGEALVREVFSYSGGPRDPFESALNDAGTGPELADLLLVAIYYDTRSPAASAVVLRDRVTSRRYTVRLGDRLGRMRVTDVRPKDVTFTLDDYGTERRETLTLRKQEDNTP